MTAAFTLWQREMVRFFRQRSRVIASLATPLLLWLFFGAGFGPSFRPAGAEEAVGQSFVYFFPGTVALIVLFTSIFTNISIIEDRREGFLQGVLVAPVSRVSIVLGKVCGGASIAALQGVVFLVIGLVGGLGLSASDPLTAVGTLLLLSVALTSVGFAFAWRTTSVQGFHAVMNFVLMPLWLLSGAVFPAAGTPAVIRALVAANPLSYGLALLRHGLGVAGPDLPPVALCWQVTVAFAVLALLSAILVASRSREG